MGLPAPRSRQVSRGPPAAFEPLDERLLARPLDFLLAEHYRVRAAVGQLDWLARGSVAEPRRKIARALAGYFKQDYGLHIADEEVDFFPLLRERCAGDESFIASLDALAAEHREEKAQLAQVTQGLARLAEIPHHIAPPPEFPVEALAFVEAVRLHIAWENAVLLPVARERLEAADLRRLAKKMAARRGLTPTSLAKDEESKIA